jgi:subtilisin family serine protease
VNPPLRGVVLAVAIGVAALAGAQQPVVVSTRCHVASVPVWEGQSDQRLVACGEQHPENTLWHLDRADSVDGSLDGRHRRQATGKGVVVYVLDSGVRRDHVEFMRPTGSIVIDGIEIGGWESFTDPACASPATDPCAASEGLGVMLSHGTAVASILGGTRAGVAPDVSIVSVRVALGADNWVRALRAVIDHAYAPTTPSFRTAIVNISGGISHGDGTELATLIETMAGGVDERGEADRRGKRFLFVTAAGNLEAGQCGPSGEVRISPAILGPRIDGVITVGGLSRANTFWAGSCGGSAVEVLAPAEHLFAASMAGSDHYRLAPRWVSSGTSYAAPYVSGLAARLLEQHPELYPSEIERILKASDSRVAGWAVPVEIEN